jgi:polar amino acid transport system permease protein
VIAIHTYIDMLPTLFKGVVVTVETLVLSAFFAFIIAFIAGLCRLSKNGILRKVTLIYVELFRGTSLLVQMFWIYFALPLFGLELSALTAGVIVLSLNYGAYASEIVRGAVLAIPKGQVEASIALNMTPYNRMTRVILPQAIKLMLPSFGNTLIDILKGTALVSLITLGDLTYQALLIRSTNVGLTTEIFTLLIFIYFVLALPLIILARWLERRASVGGA